MSKVELYNHNKTTYENITKIFEKENKCAVVQPTGSGKSFLIFKLAQDNSDKNIVVLEPNKQIIGRVSEQMKDYNITNLNFLTYQKLNSDYKKGEFSIDSVDIICLDELHRITAREWNKAIVAIQEKFPNAKILGLTATPERSDGQNIVEYFGAELACEMTLGDAIVNKILPCPTYISALYTFDEEVDKISKQIDESRNSDEEKSEMREELEAARRNLEKSMGVPTILSKHIPNKNGKYLVFCSNVEHLNVMRPLIEDWFAQAGFETHIYTVHTKYSNKNKEYKEFKNDISDCIKLCLCVDMFNEGVHLEGITGVILFRPTQSNIIYFQQIGRALTASDENTPIIFDLVNNGNSLGATSIRAEIENAIERQKENSINSNTDEISSINDFHIYDYVSNSLNVFQNIQDKCVDEFDFRLQQLKEYKEKWGHCCVMKKEAEQWEGLFVVSKRYRDLYNRENGMCNHRVQTLNTIGFVWDVKSWRYRVIVDELKKYIEQGGCIPISSKYKCQDGVSLQTKIENFKNQKERDNLDDSIEKELINMGIILNRHKTTDDKWNYNLNCLKKIVVKNGMIKLNTTNKDERALKDWYFRNLSNYQKGLMDIDKKEKFETILQYEETKSILDIKWDSYFELLKNSIESDSFKKDTPLGRWYYYQLMLKKRNALRDDRLDKINQIELMRKNKRIRWQNYINLISEYLTQNTCIVQNTKFHGVNIGKAISYFKESYKKGKFPEERYQQLLELGIDLAKEGSLM